MKNRPGSRDQWVVAHSGARDQYQLPIAMYEAGQLHRFVTDWYSSLDHPIIGKLAQCMPRQFRTTMARRFHHDLPSRFVADLKLKGVLKSVVATDAADLQLNQGIGQHAADIASNSHSHLLITSYYGWAAFPRLSKDARRVLLQVHPHPWFLRDLYCRCSSDGNVPACFQNEAEMKVEDGFLRGWGQESLDADLVIAASSFTKKSLEYTGVRPDRIVVVPYGVDTRVFRNDVAIPSGKAKILFVGQPTSRKGFQNLLETWKCIANRGAELHVVSGALPPKEEAGGTIVWHGRLSLENLVALMNRMDLLVLPSIAEGFGHVLLQALSCGTPILCSDATAGPDLLAGWEEGFVFPSGNWNEFASRLDFWLGRPARLRSLRGEARTIAEGLPWEKFREGVRTACSFALQHQQAIRN